MNVDGAAKETMELAERLAPYWRKDHAPEMSLEHLRGMMDRWSPELSETKRCRWLGWMQATVVAMTAPHCTLEDMKQISKKYAD